MWLPKEERELLAYYYRKLKEPNLRHTFKEPYELIDAIEYFRRTRHIVRKIKFWLRDKRFIARKVYKEPRLDKESAANERLHRRGLIRLEIDLMDIHVELTLQGWDIGRKYSNLLIRFGLWFAEYKDCGLGMVIGAILGIVGTVIVNRLSQ